MHPSTWKRRRSRKWPRASSRPTDSSEGEGSMAEGDARTPSLGSAQGQGASFADVPAFVHGLHFADLPADVVAQAQRCLRDLIGVAAAGSRTRLAAITS